MASTLSPAKVVLLATDLATKSDIESLTWLASRYDKVLQPELLLRIILTYLPETVESSGYVSLVEQIRSGAWQGQGYKGSKEADSSAVEQMTDVEAAKKVRRLRLLPLKSPHATADLVDDPIYLFLVHRAHRVDEEAGLLGQLPELLTPFLDHAPCIRTWMVSVLLPLVRRNYEYYPDHPMPQTLAAFEALPDRVAVGLLLEQTGLYPAHTGRDLRGLIGPWLHNEARWKHKDGQTDGTNGNGASSQIENLCPAWEQVLEWLIVQASISWETAVSAIEDWDGPEDADLGGMGSTWFQHTERGYLKKRYGRAALASAYLIPEASVEALAGVSRILTKTMQLLNEDPFPTLPVASSYLSPLIEASKLEGLVCPKNATNLRNDLLSESNILTAPSKASVQLLHALALSAYILTKAGAGCTVRGAGELAFLRDEREQQARATKLIGLLLNSSPKADEKFWIRARNEILWLRDWGAEEAAESDSNVESYGVFGQVKTEFLEVECLKAFLACGQYSLAKETYEDSAEKPLLAEALEETIIAAAMSAFGNASNPNRQRGGLRKCDDIIHAFPQTITKSSPAARRIEALLRATHGLSQYRLVLKQGEPFTPVLLRVHADPVAIIGKVLEQNAKSHTRLQEFVEVGENMVNAGLTFRDKSGTGSPPTEEQLAHQRSLVEKRVTAMCIDAALAEDDFETAYSYVVNRLPRIAEAAERSRAAEAAPSKGGATAKPGPTIVDDYSWKAALQAGRYRRTARTQRPTHLGTSSGNLEIRHLEQRMDCLSTALRIAPPATLQEIVNVFRRCEEELEAAVKAEEAQAAVWDDRGDDVQAMPGAFSSTVPAGVFRQPEAKGHRNHTEEAPMSLFDLSRASMARAQRNFTALSSLQQARDDPQGGAGPESSGQQPAGPPRSRKRDQLRQAAVGTLASGVGWLIGAQPVTAAPADDDDD